MQYTSNVCNQILFKETGSKSNLRSKLNKLKKLVGTNCFPSQFIKIFIYHQKINFNIMHCNNLHAWWSTQSRLADLLSSLIAPQRTL